MVGVSPNSLRICAAEDGLRSRPSKEVFLYRAEMFNEPSAFPSSKLKTAVGLSSVSKNSVSTFRSGGRSEVSMVAGYVAFQHLTVLLNLENGSRSKSHGAMFVRQGNLDVAALTLLSLSRSAGDKAPKGSRFGGADPPSHPKIRV